ncbi:MAG: EpsI family protein [Chthoniobacteraceae bacterium]|nr:EpsI family protein [Chthoniobacteraceae bacterium]
MIPPLSKRLGLLLAILLCGLGSVFVLPKTPPAPEPGVKMELPDFIGDWYGQDAAVSKRELEVLGSETRFARKQYTNSRGDAVYVSIVFSGEDMSASIHRPERCLPSQGYTMVDTRKQRVALDGKKLTATRLHNLRPVYDASGKPLITRDGKQLTEYSLLYYWFSGSSETTADHTARYLMDARDRILKGTSQRWAYITVMGRITANIDKFGRTEPQTDVLLQEFIRQLVPLIQKPDVKIR